MIVLPARNEAPRIASVVEEVRRCLPGVPILVVENGSQDQTGEAALAAGALLLRSQPGYARALHVGFQHALREGAPWVIQMDADGQHPGAALPSLLAALESCDLAVGSRFLGAGGYRMPLPRRLAVQALGAWASFWSGSRLRDVTSGLRAWRPEALAQVVEDFPQEIADANLLVRALRRGLVVTEVPVAMRVRAGGYSQHQLPHAALFAAKMAVLTVAEACDGYGRTSTK
jgi:glycosyltransferase involved in cell wall biosynthesis